MTHIPDQPFDGYPFPVVTYMTPPCSICQETSLVDVPTEAYDRWISGTLIQVAFPEMPMETRELMISGTHSECWDKLFSDEEGGE